QIGTSTLETSRCLSDNRPTAPKPAPTYNTAYSVCIAPSDFFRHKEMGEKNTWLNRFMTKNMSSAEIVDLSLGQTLACANQ
ncbi:hypothetical protein, partial [Comamonas thiooxydans]|uniref:hypothetical protein n=1 Tax=Comamonas thiooxydans TaxID=363952 RepID=UPI00196A1BF5